MLLYPNRGLVRVILTLTGSIFFRWDNFLKALIIAGVAVWLQIVENRGEAEWSPDFPHSFGLSALGSIVGFAVVFRTNQGWARYWDAISQLHIIYSKWGDAYLQAFAFSTVTIEKAKSLGTPEGDEKAARVQKALDKIMENFSLMSAIAADRLTHGDTACMETLKSKGFRAWNDQIILPRVLWEMELNDEKALGANSMPHLQDGTRPNSSPTRDLNSWTGMTYIVMGKPNRQEMAVLENSKDRECVVMYWIMHDLALLSSDLSVPPPIQSRMYQELSSGMLGFNQARKIADVPFPFPYAQLLSLLLIIYSCFIPIYTVVFTQSLIAGPILAFLLFEGIWGLNEVAKELENPFGPDVNDISLVDFHQRFIDVCKEVEEAHRVKAGLTRREEEIPMCAAPSLRSNPPARRSLQLQDGESPLPGISDEGEEGDGRLWPAEAPPADDLGCAAPAGEGAASAPAGQVSAADGDAADGTGVTVAAKANVYWV